MFDRPTTLAEQYREILRAAVLDSLGASAVPTPGRRARFAERLVLAELDFEPERRVSSDATAAPAPRTSKRPPAPRL